ncbi:hypothetical protein A9K55_009367 [Cordyceps militaris]|uniref:Uncharacterized protein n=1 Tax=Cordyceps militaris TaxID=73501 RepID=A0A2H4SEW3_CORMI|nr:hypothetical protein A9K55_009367 [Cordyceps militaris]
MSGSVFPGWPRSSDDLVPLPNCDGPKLEPFDFHGPQKIEFLEYIGEGLHAHVVKVQIRNRIYAVKLFRFCFDDDWLSPYYDMCRKDWEMMRAFYEYAEPFNCECRAFARLKEAGHEDLAIGCFGYLLLDEEHERKLLTQLHDHRIDFNGNIDCPGGNHDEGPLRERFLGPDGRPPPIRGIVKEYAPPGEEHEFRQADAEKMLADVKKLQQLGITRIDVAARQVIGGRISDFSTAVTTPHFATTPELNPHLTPDMRRAVELQAFIHAKEDYLEFDAMIREWNWEHAKEHGVITASAYPGHKGAPGLCRYDFRRKVAQKRVYTFVDPRLYDWKVRPRKGVKNRRRRLRAKPPLWIYRCGENDGLANSLMSDSTKFMSIEWEYRDGRIFPLMSHRHNIALLARN